MINHKPLLEAVSPKNVEIKSGLWGERQATIRDRTIPAIYHQMKKTGRLDAWKLDYQPGKMPKPHIFWDSDAGKWIEAVGYSLMTHPNPEFVKQVDEAVELIEKAQHADGYLNIFFTSVEPENRWKNLRDWHEMYDAGHLLEGAIAYYEATGHRKLLDVIVRYIDLIDERCGPKEGQIHGYDGHPEVELALVKLYRLTKDERYLNLSKFFVEERGQEPHFFDIEAQQRGDDPAKFWAATYRYCQAHTPIRQQSFATGHSVRASYLFSGVADIAAETGDAALAEVCRTVWDDTTQHQMYITGGIGPAHANEGFTFAYDLPNETAYAETCASIARVFWGQRMFHLDPNGKYIDVLERTLYNGVLSGVSFEGAHFFYANPLSSYMNINPYERLSGIKTEEYYRRSEWFDCSCCPPNLARLVGSLGSYMYSVTPDMVYVHLYNQNSAKLNLGGTDVTLEQTTNYPWDGNIQVKVRMPQSAQFTVALRIPGWCRNYRLDVNGTAVSESPQNGYVALNRTWSDGDTVTLVLDMPVERMVAHPHVRQDAGNIALQRGPVVYCLEEVDNGGHLANVAIPHDAKLTTEIDPQLFGGIAVITGEAERIEPAAWSGDLYQAQAAVHYQTTKQKIKAIPYCFWANRQPGEMRVWLRES